MVKKQSPVAFLSVPSQLAPEKSVSVLTYNQWLNRCPQIFLPAKIQKGVIFSAPQHCPKDKSLLNFSNIRILAVGGPNWTGGISVGYVNEMDVSQSSLKKTPACLGVCSLLIPVRM